MKTLTVLLVLFVVGFAAAHPWACYHGNAQHTGKTNVGVGDSLWTAWTFQAGGDISGSAAVNEQGQVVFGARNVHLYCLNADGTQAWDANLDSLGTSIYFSTPAVDDSGNVYITTSRRLVKVSPAGVVLWSYPDHNSWSISHSPVIGTDGKVYFACYSESLYAVRPNGTLDWARSVVLDVNSAPAVGLDGNIYVATTRGTSGWKLWAFTPTGDTAWTFPLDGGADFASPAVGPDSTVYVGAGRHLYAVGADGDLRWRDTLTAQASSCPAVADDSTLYLTTGSFLYCVSADSGWRWRRSLGGSNYSAPAVDASGLVYVGSAQGSFHVFAPDSTELWSMATPDDVWASPAIGPGGRVYFGCMDGSFHALEGGGTSVAEELPGPLPRSTVLLPNPSTGVVRLPVPAEPGCRVRVVSAAGTTVGMNPQGNRLDLSSLPRGVYLVEFVRDNSRSVGKVVLR